MERPRTPRGQLAAYVEGFGMKPSYRILQAPRKDGTQTWVVEAYVRHGTHDKEVRILGKGEGRTKKGAYDHAANDALRNEMSRVQVLYGRQGSDKGFQAELRVLGLLCDPPDRLPVWVEEARLATKHEDGRGIDIVVKIADGEPMWLQVKSSKSGQRKHEKKYPDSPIAVVVVRADDTDRFVFRQIMSALRSLRNKRCLPL